MDVCVSKIIVFFMVLVLHDAWYITKYPGYFYEKYFWGEFY